MDKNTFEEMERVLQQIPEEQAEKAILKAVEILCKKRPPKDEPKHIEEKDPDNFVAISDKRSIEIGVEDYYYTLTFEDLLDLISFHFNKGIEYAEKGNSGSEMTWPEFIRIEAEYIKHKRLQDAATSPEA